MIGMSDWQAPGRLGDRPGEAREGEGAGWEGEKEGGASWWKALAAGRSGAHVEDNKEVLEKMGARKALCHLSSLPPFRLGALKKGLVSKDPSLRPLLGRVGGGRKQWGSGGRLGWPPPNTDGAPPSCQTISGFPQGDASGKWLSLALSPGLSDCRALAGRHPGCDLSQGGIPLNGPICASPALTGPLYRRGNQDSELSRASISVFWTSAWHTVGAS